MKTIFKKGDKVLHRGESSIVIGVCGEMYAITKREGWFVHINNDYNITYDEVKYCRLNNLGGWFVPQDMLIRVDPIWLQQQKGN